MRTGTKIAKKLAILLTLAAVVLSVFVCAAMAEEVFEMDGSKIEGIDLFWVTPDSTVDNEGKTVPAKELNDDGSDRHDHLYLATADYADLNMTYQFEVSFSGQYDYAPGDITITIPAKVWHARSKADPNAGTVDPDRYIGSLQLSVPKAPSTKGDLTGS